MTFFLAFKFPKHWHIFYEDEKESVMIGLADDGGWEIVDMSFVWDDENIKCLVESQIPHYIAVPLNINTILYDLKGHVRT